MRKLRRAGKIGEFISIFVNEKQVTIIVSETSTEFALQLCLSDHKNVH